MIREYQNLDPWVLFLAAICEVNYEGAMSDINESIEHGASYNYSVPIITLSAILMNPTAAKNYARVMGKRYCTKCHAIKELNEFKEYRSRFQKKIYQSCNECRSSK